MVFDLTNRDTFNNVRNWYSELFDFIGKKDIPIIIIGNKYDLRDQRKVEIYEGSKIASELYEQDKITLSYIETSALSGENVVDAFNIIAYHFMMKGKEIEEAGLKEDLYKEINVILEKIPRLVISFVAKHSYWSPGFQILTEIENLGDPVKNKDEESAKIYQYPNGLVLKNSTYEISDVRDADGVFCIFDARNKDHVEPKWKEDVIKIIEAIGENKVILIGIRVSEDIDWSQLLEEFNINVYLEKKMVSVLFFKIGLEYRLEIFDQLNVMLDSIKNLSVL
jgi:hypothetical protein